MRDSKQSDDLGIAFLCYGFSSTRRIKARLYGYKRRGIDAIAKWKLLNLATISKHIKDDYLVLEDIAEAIGRTTRALKYWKYHGIIPKDFTDYVPRSRNQVVFWKDRALYFIYFFNYIDSHNITTNGEVLHTYCSKVKGIVFSEEKAEQILKEVIHASEKEKSEKAKNKKSRGQNKDSKRRNS